MSDSQQAVAQFYHAKLGRFPTPFEARNVLREELDELVVALDNGVTNVETLKELADVLYTCYGYALSRGWNLTEAFERVHASNMTKQPTTSGKIKKGDAYVAPDLTECV